MRVGGQADLGVFRGVLGAPHGGPGEEEALVAGEAVDLRIFLAGGGLLQGVVGGGQATQVGDVLAQGQLALHEHARHRLVAVELRDQLLSKLPLAANWLPESS
ncbi:hypothetical protein G6F21_014567 [Rhizopus arrhizus]|nr:hypothetical protein G6F21_014567 [Rhizopus arrhizus]